MRFEVIFLCPAHVLEGGSSTSFPKKMKRQSHGFCFLSGLVCLETKTFCFFPHVRFRQARPMNSATLRFLANQGGARWDVRTRGYLICRNDHFAAFLLEPSLSPCGGGIGGLGAAADSRHGAQGAAEGP